MGLVKCKFCAEEIQEDAIICKHCKSNLKDEQSIQNSKVLSKVENAKNEKRTMDFVLGLIGGILGIGSSFFVWFIGGIGSAFGSDDAQLLGGLAISALLFSILGIIGASMVNKNGKLAGLIMTVSSIGGIISISMGFVIPGILLIIPGIKNLRRENQENGKFSLKKHLPITLVLAVLILIVGFSSQTTVYETSATNTQSQELDIFTMDDIVLINGVEFSVNSAAILGGGQYSLLDEQDNYVVVDLNIRNIDKDMYSFNPLNFSIKNSKNQITDVEYFHDLNIGMQNAMDIGKGGTLDTYLVFSQPKSETEFSLLLKENIFSSRHVEIKLNNIENTLAISSNEAPAIATNDFSEIMTYFVYYLPDYDIGADSDDELFEIFDILGEPFIYIETQTGNEYLFNPWSVRSDDYD